MSKPVSNVEIEDVLSSIRRLVTSSDRVEREASAVSDDPGGKLVLTPSLRVDDVQAESDISAVDQSVDGKTSSDEFTDLTQEKPAESAGENREGMETANASDEDNSTLLLTPSEGEETDRAIAENAPESIENPVSGGSDPVEQRDAILPDAAEVSVQPGADNDDVENPLMATDDQLDIADGDTALPSDTGEGNSADNLQRRAAEFEAIIAEKDEQWEPDGTTEDENAAVSGGPVPWDDREGLDQDQGYRDEIDALTEDEPLSGAQEDQPFLHSTPENDAALTSDGDVVEMKTAESDLVEQSAEEQPEEEKSDETDDVLQDEPAPFVFRSRASFAGAATADTSDDSAPDDAGDTDTPLKIEEALLDEEALRDMVSEIVRQELQGALGERITRNVRKLVRREIHRALASQEME